MWSFHFDHRQIYWENAAISFVSLMPLWPWKTLCINQWLCYKQLNIRRSYHQTKFEIHCLNSIWESAKVKVLLSPARQTDQIITHIPIFHASLQKKKKKNKHKTCTPQRKKDKRAPNHTTAVVVTMISKTTKSLLWFENQNRQETKINANQKDKL